MRQDAANEKRIAEYYREAENFHVNKGNILTRVEEHTILLYVDESTFSIEKHVLISFHHVNAPRPPHILDSNLSSTMAATSKMTRRLGKNPLLIVILSVLIAFSSAIDLTKAFGGRKRATEDDSQAVATDADDAIANAKKLVEDMNDAATGTVTSYQPGREKEPVSCNDIMAKALVVANEEKAAIIEERDSVVKAASLLSDRIDDLQKKLHYANDQIEVLKGAVTDASANTKVKLDEAAAQSNEHLRMMSEDASNARAKADKEIREMQEFLAKSQEDTAEMLKKERDRAKLKMDELRNSTKAKIDDIKETCHNQVIAAERDRNKQVNAAERRIRDAEIKAEEEVIQSKKDADVMVKKAQQDADDKIAASLADAELMKNALIGECENKVASIQTQAKKRAADLESKMDDMKKQIQDQAAQFEDKYSQLKAKTASDIKQAHKDAKIRVKEALDELDMAVAGAEMKIKAQKHQMDEARLEFEEGLKEAADTQKALVLDIQEAKSSSSHLQKEVNFWKQTHDSQSYCNITLMRQDSGKIVTKGIEKVRNGIEVGQEFLVDLMGKQLATIQRIGSEMTLYIENELIPSFQLIVNNGRVKAIALYDEHLADVVNKNVIPVYNEHIYPVYNQNIQPAYKEHVAPIVKTIEKEAAVAITKTKKEATKARSSAATLVKQSSSSAIKLIEEKEADSILPSWIMQKLEQSSEDGESVVDALCKGLLILVLILCRSLIFRVIGIIFAIVWFFCPLRLLFRKSGSDPQGEAASSAKPPQ